MSDVSAPPPEGVGESEGDEVSATDAPPSSGLAQVRSFGDVVALAGQRRDAKLKIHLEDHVSLVKFDAAAGSIDIFLLPGAPRELANDLREKLNRWTGRRWVVVLSKVRGDRSLGEIRREREAEELKRLKAHPAVAAVLEEFPEAKITVRKTGAAPKSETGTG
jgi:DNA polymerase-3 subunit gamma/tau